MLFSSLCLLILAANTAMSLWVFSLLVENFFGVLSEMMQEERLVASQPEGLFFSSPFPFASLLEAENNLP